MTSELLLARSGYLTHNLRHVSSAVVSQRHSFSLLRFLLFSIISGFRSAALLLTSTYSLPSGLRGVGSEQLNSSVETNV